MHLRVTIVVLCVCLSVTMLAATFLVGTLKVVYGVFKILVVWLLLKILCSKVLV